MSANQRQVGGEHYKRDFQHWDLMALANAGYFAGQVTKYTERHSRKNGREDLEKALHFAEKMHEVTATVRVPKYERHGLLRRRVPVPVAAPPENPKVLTAVREYAVDAGLTAIQERIYELCLLRPDRTEDIVALCRRHLDREYGAVSERPPQASIETRSQVPTFMMFEDGVPESRVVLDVTDDGLVSMRAIDDKRVQVEEEAHAGTPEDGGQHSMVCLDCSGEGFVGDVQCLLCQGTGDIDIPPLPRSDDPVVSDVNEVLAQALATMAADQAEPTPKPKTGRTPAEKSDPRKK